MLFILLMLKLSYFIHFYMIGFFVSSYPNEQNRSPSIILLVKTTLISELFVLEWR